jgi:hypothetical protein
MRIFSEISIVIVIRGWQEEEDVIDRGASTLAPGGGKVAVTHAECVLKGLIKVSA